MNYVLHLLVYLDIYVLVALSLNLAVGYCGLLSLAHAGLISFVNNTPTARRPAIFPPSSGQTNHI